MQWVIQPPVCTPFDRTGSLVALTAVSGAQSRKTCRRKARSTTILILWTYDGTLQRIYHALYEQCREQAQREASPTAAIIDSRFGVISVRIRSTMFGLIEPTESAIMAASN